MAFDYTDREELPLFQYVKDQLNEAIEAREEIIHATDEQNYEALKEIEEEYLERLEPLRLVGNLALKCFFDGKNEKERTKNLEKHSLEISNFLSANNYEKLEKYCYEKLHDIDPHFDPFHWELEFPEVFTRDNSGFDCFVGNPPFADKNQIIKANGDVYLKWLQFRNRPAHGAADYSAHFFRLCFYKLRYKGSLGLIATQTISQGNTRNTGLGPICELGGTIYHAETEKPWPGEASVFVSTIHIIKGNFCDLKLKLNGKTVNVITPFLRSFGPFNDPFTLSANLEKAFQGCQLSSQGFLISEKSEIFNIFKNIVDPSAPQDKVLKPFFSGDEINTSVGQVTQRYVLDLDGKTALELEAIPNVLEYAKNSIYKDLLKRKQIVENEAVWWNFRRPSLEFRKLTKTTERVLVTARVSQHLFFSFIPSTSVASDMVVIFKESNYHNFSILSSSLYYEWVEFFTGAMGEGFLFSLSDCFENFPMPMFSPSNNGQAQLEAYGQRLNEIRQEYMANNSISLTEFYNRYHSQNFESSNLQEFRDLIENIDATLFDLYGWSDLLPSYEYRVNAIDHNDTVKGKNRTAYRFTELLQTEAIARLVELNKVRYEEEVRLGLHKR